MSVFTRYTMLLHMWTGVVYGQMWTDVKNLKRELLLDYDTTIRPVVNQSQTVIVNASLNLLNVQDIDEVSGRFSVTGFTTLSWQDEHLTWEPFNRSSISSMIFKPDDIWVPPLTLTNPFMAVRQLGNAKDRLRVYPDGTVLYVTGDVFQASCSMDITYYPFDKQICYLFVSAFEYELTEIEMASAGDTVFTRYFSENNEWTLVEAIASSAIAEGSNSIRYTFKLERKSGFIYINVILPIAFMSFINIMVFVLPSDSGERVGFAVTVLLAIVVFLTMIGDNLPKASDPMPILSNWLQAILTVSVAECVMTIVSLHIYHKDDTKYPPRWLQFLVGCRLSIGRSRLSRSTVGDKDMDPTGQDLKVPLPPDIEMDRSTEVMSRVTWKYTSRVFDSICLVLFIIVTIAVSCSYILKLRSG